MSNRFHLVSRALWWALVVVLFCLPLFAGLGRTDLQNDEAIYSYAVDSILETGDWLNPRSSPHEKAVFLEKPPLKFWIVALPIRLGLLPDNEFGLRFWDAVFGSAVFLYLFGIGWRLAGPLCGLVAGLLLFSFSPLLFDHGLRSNNMDAALMLAYCGGVYHYLRWAESRPARSASAPYHTNGSSSSESRPASASFHAFAVGGYCFLGFMTKFVAVAFLPLILGLTSLLLAPVRRRLRSEWRLWAGVTALAAIAAAPWFIYQMAQPGHQVWTVMFGEHVYRRFSASLDPEHLHPWSFYLTYLSTLLKPSEAMRLVIPGAVLLLIHTVRRRWMDGACVLVWLALPLTLISIGTSKLEHYIYPYLPPVALVAGYLMASILRFLLDAAAGRWPGWLDRVVVRVVETRWWVALRNAALNGRRTVSRVRSRRPVLAWLLLGVRVALGGLAAFWLFLAVIALAHPGRLTLAGLTLARNPIPLKLSVNALLVAIVAGYGRRVFAVALPVILIALSPVAAYRATLPRLTVESHPLRTAGECLTQLRHDRQRAGLATPNLFVYVPHDFVHPYFFYLRSIGWEWHDTLSPQEFRSIIGIDGTPRPALVAQPLFERLWQPYGRTGLRSPERVALRNVLLLLPGPYAGCADAR